MTVPTTSWSESTPAGSDNINAGDNRIRELKTQIREVVDVDHKFDSSGQDSNMGKHNQISFIEQDGDSVSGAEGLPVLLAQTVGGKAELVFTDEDDNDVQITSGGSLLLTKALVNDLAYPIGSVYTAGVSTNPATLLGVGTWEAITGRVIVGIDSGTFDLLDEELGAETVTLTGAQSGVAPHTHDLVMRNANGAGSYIQESGDTGGSGGQVTGAVTGGAASAAEAHSNLQPSITKYVWQRTA